MTAALTHLGNISIDVFLKEYWQKKPLFIHNAFPNFDSPIDGDELAGLSLEEESHSRLVIEDPKTHNWQVQHGPLDEEVFQSLPSNNWSLLVQHVDSLDPDVNALLEKFRFIPNWRLDDIMASYAVDKGGVGPHFDYYDVFLLQGSGRRRWRIGQHCNAQSPLVADQPMKILQTFEACEDWEVGPGDLIYIPAQIAHWGEAIGESITYSIGFRSPSHNELLLDFTQTLSASLNEDQRYRDSALHTDAHVGEINADAIAQLNLSLHELIDKPAALSQWLGEYSTQLKPGIEPHALPLNFATEAQWHAGDTVKLSTFCRSAYVQNEKTFNVFINGDTFCVSESLAKQLTSYSTFSCSDIDKNDVIAVLELIRLKLLVGTTN